MGGKQERPSIDRYNPAGSSRSRHPQNQRASKREEQAGIKGFGRIDRAYKTALREERIERSLEEFEGENRVRIQREQAVQHGLQHGLQHGIQRLFGVNLTLEEICILAQGEQVIDHYRTSKGTEVIVTTIDFTRPNSKSHPVLELDFGN